MIEGMWLTSITAPVHVGILSLGGSLVCTPLLSVRSYTRRYTIGAADTIL
ncbi:hypothetical protein LINGRAPRIM_LOCUS2351 [Linum grandiflorum]